MRVAFLGEVNYPSHNIKWVNHIISEFGVEGIVLTFPDQNHEFIDKRIKVYKELEPFPVTNFVKRLSLSKRISVILEENNIQLVHFLWGVDIVLWASILKIPYVITTRGSDVLRLLPNRLESSKSSLRRFLIKRILRKRYLAAYLEAGKITSTSEIQQATLKKCLNTELSQCIVVRTGIYPEKFPFDKRKIGFTPPVLNWLSPRTMRSLYQQDIIIRAFRIYLESYPNASLRLIDNHPNTPWSDNINFLVNSLKITDSVTFLPELNQSEMRTQYEWADITINIPKTDGTPVSVLEAMSIGTPTILGNAKYDEEIFNYDSSWFLEHMNETNLLTCVDQINKVSKLKMNQMVSSNSNMVKQKANTNIEMRKIFAVYESLK